MTLTNKREFVLLSELVSKLENNDYYLTYALGAAEETVDAKIKGKKPDFTLLVGEQMR